VKKQFRIFGVPIWETRSESLGTLDQPSPQLLQTLGGISTSAGVNVTESSILTLTAVWRAVNILSGTIAALPLHVYKRNDDGSRLRDDVHRSALVLNQPNKNTTDFIFRETLQAVLLMWGNTYAIIRRDDNGYPKELIMAHPSSVLPLLREEERYYQVRVDNYVYTVPGKDMIHVPGLSFDGKQGYSPLTVMRESMGLSLAAQTFGARFFGSGANMDGVIQVPGSLNDTAYDRIRTSWNEKYRGLSKSHNTAILEGDAKYVRIGIPPEDAQFLETRQFQIAEVARMFGIAPHLLMDLERATHNNIEHQGMEFVMFTLTPWIKRWEAELNKKLFNADDRGKYFCEFNLNGLLRGDSKARSDYYRAMFSIGSMSPNQIRKLENEPPYEGGDQYFAQGAYIPIDAIKNKYNDGNTKK
jgi:HK97 family phage portal protein